MANLKSAIKKIRVDVRRKKHNDTVRESYKEAIRSAKKTAGKKSSEKSLSEAYKKIDKAAKANVIHKNKAARLKSRLSSKLTRKA